MPLDLARVRRFAVSRTFGSPTSLARALDGLGFVQADPIRAPARAQDLTLRHRVRTYRAGDLERFYPMLDVEEDTFINYGFVTRRVYELMHPRSRFTSWTSAQRRRIDGILDFVRERGAVHPRDVERQFTPGRVRNFWGGTSNATTHLLDLLHYRGLLRIAARQDGIRTYEVREPLARPTTPRERDRRLDHLVDVLVHKYAPLTSRGLAIVVRRLRYAAPQWYPYLGAAITRARKRLPHARVDGVDWFWPETEEIVDAIDDEVRLLTPFDPLVWDRERFERLWGWQYRFEAYTPAARRVRGYYALPVLWRERVVGWANVSVSDDRLDCDTGFVDAATPRERGFGRAFDEEMERLGRFLRLPSTGASRRRRE